MRASAPVLARCRSRRRLRCVAVAGELRRRRRPTARAPARTRAARQTRPRRRPPTRSPRAAGAAPPATAPDEESAASRAVRDYVEAIDDRDGAAGVRAARARGDPGLQLPREGAGCAASLERLDRLPRPARASRSSARPASTRSATSTVGAGEARVTATVVTRFADRDEPSIEDDLIYLVELDGEWRVAKPSADAVPGGRQARGAAAGAGAARLATHRDDPVGPAWSRVR